MTKKEIEISADRIEEAASNLHRSAKSVEDASDTVQKMANTVDTNVAEGIQPDIRELRIWMSDIDQKADIRLKRILWTLWIIAILNTAILVKLFVL